MLCALFWKIRHPFFRAHFSSILDRIRMEHIEQISSSESKLSFVSICSIRIRSRNREKRARPYYYFHVLSLYHGCLGLRPPHLKSLPFRLSFSAPLFQLSLLLDDARTRPIQHLKSCVNSFLKKSRFLERILMEHIDTKDSLDSWLQIVCICSIRIRSRTQDIRHFCTL